MLSPLASLRHGPRRSHPLEFQMVALREILRLGLYAAVFAVGED